MADDKYDKEGWVGPNGLWTLSKDDEFNRCGAGHDESLRKGLYPPERADQLFKERCEKIAEFYDEPELKRRAKVYGWCITRLAPLWYKISGVKRGGEVEEVDEAPMCVEPDSDDELHETS